MPNKYLAGKGWNRLRNMYWDMKYNMKQSTVGPLESEFPGPKRSMLP